MNARPAILCVALASAPTRALAYTGVWIDPAGDAAIRRTDVGATGAFREQALPDLLSVTLRGWDSPTAATDPYTGSAVAFGSHLVRIDVEFAGLFNPPGPLGLGFYPFDPYRFGDRPVYGFVEIDMDDRKSTGGEMGGAATVRYLANIGRFGRLPTGSLSERAARSADDYDNEFDTDPQIERSGAEFVFGFCGCSDTVFVSQVGNGDMKMDPGETFIVRGRFFRRSGGFQEASAVFGGSQDGLYDPLVNVRFAHDIPTDRTMVTVVYALDMTGAGQLSGQSPEPMDFDVSNQTSVAEAMQDVIDAADGLNGPLDFDERELLEDWAGDSVTAALDVSMWRVTALFGTTYTSPQAALYIWTDTGFNTTFGDFNGDGHASGADRYRIQQYIASHDGGPRDADGVVNGSVAIPSWGYNFSVYDLNNDGVVDLLDLVIASSQYLTGDVNGDGVVNSADLGALLGAWGPCAGGCPADISGDGKVGSVDLALLLGGWGGGP